MLTLKTNFLKYKDANGDMQDSGMLFAKNETDTTLAKSGVAADAKAAGDKIAQLFDEKANKSGLTLGVHTDGLVYIFVDGAPHGNGLDIKADVVEGDVFGYVDENNTIVLNGALAEGTYTVKYEMEDGSTVEIGDLVLDSNTYYTVANTLTNCTTNNTATKVIGGESYTATITANSGYELKSVTVTMGGSPVTVSGGNINISNVTGNIVITAVAEVAGPAYTNQIPISTDANGNLYVGTNGEKGYKTGYRLSLSGGGESAQSGYECTGFIPAKLGDTLRFKNIDTTANNYTNFAVYDSTKTPYKGGSNNCGLSLNGLLSYGSEENGVYTVTLSHGIHNSIGSVMAFFRVSSQSITDESIITVNQEIK